MIGAAETVRVRYRQNEPEVESERRSSRSTRAVGGGRPTPSKTGKPLSNVKREERERRQRGIRTRRAAVAAGLAVAAAAVLWGVFALYRAPIFTIQRVEVSGNTHFTDAQVRAKAAVPAGTTLLRLPAASIERRLEQDPWVADATLDRDFPSTLRIRLRERTGTALVDAGGANIWVISDDGHWLGPRAGGQGTGVVIGGVEVKTPRTGRRVTQPEIVNAVRVLNGLSAELKSQVKSVSAPSVEETALKTKDGVEIFVGSATDIGEKDRIVRQILAEQKHVVYINVRVTDRPTWRGLEDKGE